MFKEAGTEQICQSYSTDKEAISDLTQKLSNIIRSIISLLLLNINRNMITNILIQVLDCGLDIMIT